MSAPALQHRKLYFSNLCVHIACLTLFTLPLAVADEENPPSAASTEKTTDKPMAKLELTVTDTDGQPLPSADRR